MKDIREYHDRTKHRLNRYAAGPGYMDWQTQPNPFREYEGAQVIQLPMAPGEITTPYDALFGLGAVAPKPLDMESVSHFFRLSLALAAWKAYGEAKWALRVNPSSGNLHAEEAYLLTGGLPGLEGGVYHYNSLRHCLESRWIGQWDNRIPPGMFMIGLSSIHWREAWKYGERAYRYCQLDIGHALLCLRMAATALGWRARLAPGAADQSIAEALGLDREDDFAGAETETPDALVMVFTDDGGSAGQDYIFSKRSGAGSWQGMANIISARHSHDWPVIEDAAKLTEKPETEERFEPHPMAAPLPPCGRSQTAAHIITTRRSGQAYDGSSRMSTATFNRILMALLPRPGQSPWDMIPWPAMVHPVFFIHHVDDYPHGVYILVRRPGEEEALKKAMGHKYTWARPQAAPDGAPFYMLKRMDARGTATMLSCQQDIAGDGVFSLGMMARYADNLAAGPWWYRRLHWEAGAIGQALYLEAEAAGFRGTGIGCYYDDMFHSTIGVDGEAFADLYHFTVGMALEDNRITTKAPYQAMGQ
ncbi:MAG: nitroreductase [Nitrospinota bacterium]|nr:nitroreductase [Nitrospinota bacterium]